MARTLSKIRADRYREMQVVEMYLLEPWNWPERSEEPNAIDDQIFGEAESESNQVKQHDTMKLLRKVRMLHQIHLQPW